MRKEWLLSKAGALAVVVLCALAATPAGATLITASPVDFSIAQGAVFNGAGAPSTAENPAAVRSDFTASIDWGDGSSPTMGTIGSSSAAFVVIGQHTYSEEGSFTATVTISDVSPGTGTATATDTATVTEGDSLSGTPVTFTATAGTSFTGTVANFTDGYTGNTPPDFIATVDRGAAPP